MVNLRLPDINAPTTDGQIRQIRSYLYQMVDQLRFALVETDTQLAKVSAASLAPGGGAVDKTPESIFNQIKSLIIKSADIINAYYEEISAKLDGEYVAVSDFGTYTEETQLLLDATSRDITQLYSNIQIIESEFLNSTISTSAYIRTGLLEPGDDGAPIYGVEVGQTNVIDGVETFSKFARFTANRMSFYDANDTEVAYISDYKLHITNAEISGKLTLGRWIFDTTNGLAIKWGGVS